jgi:hypothetical protein
MMNKQPPSVDSGPKNMHQSEAALLRLYGDHALSFFEAYLMGVNLQRAYFDGTTTALENALLGDEKHGALPHIKSAFSPPLLRAKCGIHENLKGRSYVRQCVP